MSIIFRCNRNGCETRESARDQYGDLPDEWFFLRSGSDEEYHFCSRDCLMFWSAQVTKPNYPKVTLRDENFRPIISNDDWHRQLCAFKDELRLPDDPMDEKP